MRRMVKQLVKTAGVAGILVGLLAVPAAAQVTAPARGGGAPAQGTEPIVPADYVIGVDDVLQISAWKDPDLTAEVAVRPDGKITLPLLNDVQAAGLTTEQLRVKILQDVSKVQDGAIIMVRVKEVKSRYVTIMGEVVRVGPVPILSTMTVLDLLSRAGGFTEFANKGKIVIIRRENGVERTFNFNYNDVSKGKNLRQNIELKAGDQVIVPE
jgi:polysaccharide biosynthesis/export protein